VAAANALLARVLYQERFQAATAANAVIGTSGISFAANYLLQ
jgi:hypothetical protein